MSTAPQTGLTPPRVPPLPDDEWDDRTRSSLAGLLPERRRNVRGAGNALATLVRHPDLTASFLGLNAHLLLRSTLPARLRELAILRVAARRGCVYETTHHRRMAAAEGLSAEEIELAEQGRTRAGADELDVAVLRAVDELDGDGSRVGDQTWALLRERLDERQCMDLVFTVGTYGLLAMAFNTFGVEPEA